jgi:5-methylthioadenosine/S-adenosylhomocysteine deaminase
MLLGGITCFADMYEHADVVAEVANESGVRAVLGIVLRDVAGDGSRDVNQRLHEGLELHDRLKGEPRIRSAFAPWSPNDAGDATLGRIRQLADELEASVHTQLHETDAEIDASIARFGLRPLDRLRKHGLLTPGLIAAHANRLAPAEVDALATAGASVVHCARANLKLANGVCPIAELLRAGVNVALGTDGTSTSDRSDMLRSLGIAALIHRVGDMDYETWVTAEEAFEMATTGSALSCGLADEIGVIEVGRKADLVLLDREDYGFIPLFRPIQQLAYAVNSDAVRTVLVDGEVIMEERVLTRIDEAALKAEMIEVATAFVRDHMPTMERMAARFLPYYRAAHMRAAATDVPASRAPVRLPCGCHAGFRHTLTCD